MTGAAPERTGDEERLVPPLVDESTQDDPLDGIPAEVLDMVDGYDQDTAGGCG